MEFLTQFKQTFQTALAEQNLIACRALLNQFHKTNLSYDADIYYFESALAYYEGRFALARFWGRLCYEKYPEQPNIQEILECLTLGDSSCFDYSKPTFDCSFLSRRYRIVVYEGLLEIMDYNAEQFVKAFTALGHEVFILNHKQFKENSNELLDFARAGLDFVLVFNNIGSCISDGSNHILWDTLKVPCINFLFDHPFYYIDDIDLQGDASIITCVDRNHVRWLERFQPNIKHRFYFPLGGEYISPKQDIPWAERPIDVIYTGGLKNVSDAPTCILTELVTSYLLSNPSEKSETAFELCLHTLFNACRRLGIQPGALEDIPYDIAIEESDFAIRPENRISDDLLKQIIFKYRYTDMAVNSHYRKELIKQLVQSGIHVTVYGGSNWEQADLTCYDTFHYMGYTTQEICIQKMQQSKIVLNNLPWFKDGTHDRILNAMLCGAVCVTDSSKYLEENFTGGEDIVFYDLHHMEALPTIVQDILSHPERSAQIAARGFEKVALSHTWDVRAMELLERVSKKQFD